VSALDVNNSQLAVPVEAALDVTLEALPELIFDALSPIGPDATRGRINAPARRSFGTYAVEISSSDASAGERSRPAPREAATSSIKRFERRQPTTRQVNPSASSASGVA
jgi:hypothetical protein